MGLTAASASTGLHSQENGTLYKYKPLPSSSSFRVLELLPGDENDDISYRLHLADWNSPPPYEAISYAWGDPKIKVPTICHDHMLVTTPSLRDGLMVMRHKDHSRFLWADAVCIDQTNDKERGHQVSNMPQIYRNATKVLVWLGRDNGHQTKRAVTAMQEIASACCERSRLSVAELKDTDDLYDVIPDDGIESLKCDNPESWRSLAWFFSLPWFSRLWVFQEVNAGSEVEMLCGNYKVKWDIAALAATYVKYTSNLRRYCGFLESFYGNAYFMRDRKWHVQSTLPDLLGWGRCFATSEPLDRIFALMGMPQFPKMDPRWKADYSKSKLELYRDVAMKCILELKELEVLCFVQHIDEIDEGFPSWVPQWDQEDQQCAIANSVDFKWKAGGKRSVSARVDLDLSVLKVGGIAFDVVGSVQRVNAFEWFDSAKRVLENHPVLEFWRSQNSRPTSYPTAEPSIEAYSLVLTTGMDFDSRKAVDDYVTFRADFAAYIIRLLELSGQDTNQYSDFREESTSTGWSRYETFAFNRSWNRSLFFTRKGYMGLGPNCLRVGDIVCVLFGATVPFILRPKYNYYQLVGEAYVHGIMEGEAMQQCEAGELEKRIFEIQ